MRKKYLNQDGKEITQQEYLYGSDVTLPEIPEDVIMIRLKTLNNNLKDLLEYDYSVRDEKRISAILKAITFWVNINEVKLEPHY